MNHIRVDLPNTNNKCVVFELANVNIFIIRVRFRLTNVDTTHRYKLPPLDITRYKERIIHTFVLPKIVVKYDNKLIACIISSFWVFYPIVTNFIRLIKGLFDLLFQDLIIVVIRTN